MRLRITQAVMLCGLASSSALAQSPLDRGPSRGFDLAIIPALSLGFNAVRAWQSDAGPTGCSGEVTRCFSYSFGNAPMAGADVQVPLGRFFGLSVGGAIGKGHRVQCKQGTNCQSDLNDPITMLKASGLLLFRLKPQAPVFLGLGYGASRSPGAVVGQDSTLTEQGPVAEIGFDLSLGQQVGLRISWWHYWMGTNEAAFAGLGLCQDLAGANGCFRPESTVHDQLLSFGARVRLPK